MSMSSISLRDSWLLALALVGGLVDAASYLGLGR
jgi:uncharacterized membrane protein YoaK (UPF0700 family)